MISYADTWRINGRVGPSVAIHPINHSQAYEMMKLHARMAMANV